MAAVVRRRGIDIFFGDWPVDVPAAKEDGLWFAYVRWGQRGTWNDSRALAYWGALKAAHVARGGYWVWDQRAGDGAEEHMAGVLEVMPLYDGELRFAVDLELEPVDWDEFFSFLVMLEGWSGRRPIIYSGSWIMERLAPLPDWLAGYDWWLTGYNDVGPDIYGPLAAVAPRVVVWQRSDTYYPAWASNPIDQDEWLGGPLDFWREIMGDKVVNAAELMAWIESNAYEIGTPTPPPLPLAFALAFPLAEPRSQYRLSQDFNLHPEWYTGVGGHDGLDYAIPEGTPVLACHDGAVTVSGYRPGVPADPYGDHVRIEQQALDHLGQERAFTTIYAHLDRLDVAVGQAVTKGQQVGLSGGVGSRAGNSTGPHLHFGVKCAGAQGRGDTFLNGDFMNPWLWLTPISAAVLERRRTLTQLRIRNFPTTVDTLTRRIMDIGVTFSVYEIRNGWGAVDVSRTGWSSLNPAYSGAA